MNVCDPTAGITGPIDDGQVEALQRRRDTDRARWLGSPVFSRPATTAETAHVGPHTTGGLITLVDCRGGRYRRSWPQLAADTSTARDSFANPAGIGQDYDPKTDRIRERKL